jgi:hypothetical protein
VNILNDLIVETGAIYIMNQGCLDFSRLYKIHQASAFFVTRAKINFSRKHFYSQPIDKTTDVQCDQIVTLKGYHAKKDYPGKLRSILYFGSTNNKTLVFLTNNFTLPAIMITELYCYRWQSGAIFQKD